MRSKDSGEPQAAVPGDVKPGTATDQVAPLDPRDPIEVASSGGGGVNDPSGTDRRPPGLTSPTGPASSPATTQAESGGTSPSGREPLGSVRAKEEEGEEAQCSPRHSP